MPKTFPSEPTRKRVDRPVHRLTPALAALLPTALLAACGMISVPGGGPRSGAEFSLPPTPKARRGATASPPPPPALAPLATPQQVVKAVSVGRRDPFGNVLVPTVIQEREAPANGTRSPSPPRELAWPKGLAFEGVLQSSSESEAMVSYRPEETGRGGPRAGSLRVGDFGTPGFNSLLPPGWEVAAIDGERGVLVLRKDGQTVSQALQNP